MVKNNELFQEMLIQKDKTIMALTNEVFELETEKQEERRKSSCESLKSDTVVTTSQQNDTDLSFDELKVLFLIHSFLRITFMYLIQYTHKLVLSI